MKIRIKKDERIKTVTCENCKKEHVIKLDDLKLLVAHQSYKLYSWECPCCGKTDYVRDKSF